MGPLAGWLRRGGRGRVPILVEQILEPGAFRVLGVPLDRGRAVRRRQMAAHRGRAPRPPASGESWEPAVYRAEVAAQAPVDNRVPADNRAFRRTGMTLD